MFGYFIFIEWELLTSITAMISFPKSFFLFDTNQVSVVLLIFRAALIFFSK